MQKKTDITLKHVLDSRFIIALAVTLIFWSSAYAGIRLGLQSYSSNHLVVLRFITASFVLFIYALITRMPLPEKKDVPILFLHGFLGITIYHVFLAIGEIKVTAGSASLIISSAPIFTAILAVTFLKEKVNIWGWIGIIVSFLGIGLVTLGEGKGIRFEPAAFLILVSAISSSIYTVLQKPFLKKYRPVQYATYAIWAGTFFLLLLSDGLFQTIQTAPVSSTLAIVYLGVFPAALAYVTWSYIVSRIPASIAATYLYLSPLLAIIIALIWLGELPSWLSLTGGILTLVGVITINMRGK